ncbi:MAG: hypothetical protein GEV10_25270 [Streptosporangiales bacterium]|nr:hypothetical protein [Streptosporangiales bacterium]
MSTSRAPGPDPHPITQPALEYVGERAGLLVQNRPVVSLSAWLSDALRSVTTSHRALYIITPSTSRITPPIRFLLPIGGSRWVVREPDGDECYDGLSGARLHWNGEQYQPVVGEKEQAVRSPTFLTEQPGLGRQLIVNLRVRHAATTSTVLGGACAMLAEALSGARPAGWGTAEPVSQSWRESDITAFARRRAPKPTWFVIGGGGGSDGARPLLGSIEVHRVPSGLDEHIALYVGYGPDEPLPTDDLPAIVDDLASAFTVVTLVAQFVSGRRDLTYTPHWSGFPRPLGLLAGNEAVSAVGLGQALAPPRDVTGIGVGDALAPGVYYPLRGDADDEGWFRFKRVLKHLGVDDDSVGS